MLKEFLAPAERVDLATSNSTKQITEHLVIEVHHVDSRGVTRTLKLHFGILDGLRFYAITMNVMEVINHKHQEAQFYNLAMLYAQEPRVLMITGYDDDDNDTNESLESTFTMLLQGPRPPIIAGLTLQRGGIHFPMAVRVQPEAFINQLLSGVAVSRRAARVDRLMRRGNVWQVLDAAGQGLEEAPTVIVAAACATQDILSASGLLAADARLRTMHQLGGEITYLPERAISGGPRCIVSGDGYVLPAVSGLCVTGSSYLHGADQVFVTSAGARENMQRTDGLLGSRLVEACLEDRAANGWAGWRAVLPGRLPAIGAVDEEQTLWAVAGLASRGLTWSSLAGDLVAATLNGEPSPLETDIIDKISQI